MSLTEGIPNPEPTPTAPDERPMVERVMEALNAAEEPAKEEAPPEPTPDAGDEDGVLDAESEALVRELEGLRAQKERFDQLSEYEQQLTQKAQQLEAAGRLENLLRYPKFRTAVQAAMNQTAEDPEFDWGQKDPTNDGIGRILDQFKDPRVDEILPKMQTVDVLMERLMPIIARENLNDMRSNFQKEFGADVVTEELWSEIENGAADTFGEKISPENIERYALLKIAKLARANGTDAVKKALSELPKGAVVIPAGSTRRQTSVTPPAPKGMPAIKDHIASLFRQGGV